MKHPIPDIQASPELVQAFKQLLKEPRTCKRLLGLVRAEITPYLWEDANFFHARIIGQKLAISLKEPPDDEGWSEKWRQRNWESAFSEDRIADYSLDIEGAYGFVYQLKSCYPDEGKRRKAVDALHQHLQKLYPIQGEGCL